MLHTALSALQGTLHSNPANLHHAPAHASHKPGAQRLLQVNIKAYKYISFFHTFYTPGAPPSNFLFLFAVQFS